MILRQGLLEGKTVAVSGSVTPGVRETLLALGALIAPPDSEVQALVHDAGAAFDGEGLTAALEQAWSATAEVAAHGLIPGGRAGKVVLVAPRPSAGPYAAAARDGLENLARTLSVEWARFGITTVAIMPGDSTTGEDLATVICFLLSRAGDYFTGCRLELGAAG